MVHFFQVRLQQYLNLEFPDVPAEFRKCQGSASAGSRGYPQDEQRRGERKRERERMTRRGCLQGLAESGNALFFTVAFIS